jgi:hypothetical protein
MTMRDWIVKLDDFLKLSGRELLTHAGKISADDAKAKAEIEYLRYRRMIDNRPRQVDDAFDAAAKVAKTLKRPNPERKPRKKDGEA